MKRLLFAFLIFTLLLAGCATASPATEQPVTPTEGQPAPAPTSATGEQTTTETSPESGQRVLHVFSYVMPEPTQQGWAEVYKAFEEEFGVKVDLRMAGKWAELPQNLEAARMAGETIDITYATATLVGPTLAPSGILMDLTDLVEPFKDRFVPNMLNFYTHGGHVWAIPHGVASTSLVYYNVDMFKELGLSEPKTYEEWVNVVNTIREKKGIEPFIHQGKHPWYWPMWFFETFAQTSGNKSIQFTQDFLSGNRKFTSPEEIAAFNEIARIYQDGILHQSDLDVDGDGMKAAFAQQKAAMFYGGLWELSATRTIVNGAFEVGVFEFPLMVSADGVVPLHGGGPDDGWGIPTFAPKENIDIQTQFLEFITRPEIASLVISKQEPYIPTIQGVAALDDPLAKEMNEEFMPHTIQYLDWMWPTEVNDVMTQVIPAVMVGSMTAEEAAQQVQDAYDTVVLEKDYQFNWWDKWTEEDWAKVTPPSIPEIVVP